MSATDGKTKIDWMETRFAEVAQYHCRVCKEIFQFASDKNGTLIPPVNCPMCGLPHTDGNFPRDP